MIFLQKLKGDESIGLVDIYKKGHLGWGNRQGKGPESGTCFMCFLLHGLEFSPWRRWAALKGYEQRCDRSSLMLLLDHSVIDLVLWHSCAYYLTSDWINLNWLKGTDPCQRKTAGCPLMEKVKEADSIRPHNCSTETAELTHRGSCCLHHHRKVGNQKAVTTGIQILHVQFQTIVIKGISH